jgi:hypothetical protein
LKTNDQFVSSCLIVGMGLFVLGCGGRVAFDGSAQGGAGADGSGGGPVDCPPEGFLTLAADVDTTPTGIAVSATGVSWTSDDAVWIAGLEGEFPSALPTPDPILPWAIAADGDELYVAGQSSALRRIVRSSGALVWELPDAAYDIALDDVHVYFTNNLGVFRVAREGGEVTELEPLAGTSLARDGENLVVLARDDAGVTVRALPAQGGPSTPIASVASLVDCSSCSSPTGFLDRVALAEGFAFFAVDTRLYRVPTAGGTLDLVLDAAPLELRAVVSAGATVYVGVEQSPGDGAILRVDPGSLEITDLVRGDNVAPWSLAPSPLGVYWSTYQSSGIIGRTCGL